jgi:hypothetical protein
MTMSKIFFVQHLSERSYRPHQGAKYEVQLLDGAGQSRAEGYFGVDDTQLIVNGEVVPLAVLEAARRQLRGQGDYVNEDGHTVAPF